MTESVLMVGLGAVARTHLKVLADLPQVEVIAGVDPSPPERITFRGLELPVAATLQEVTGNALSVLTRFCSPRERISLRQLNESTYEARVRCTSDGKPFEALIVTSWQVTDAARRTSLRFASGAELLLDHHVVAAYLVQKGRITDQFGTDGSVPRRESHYIGLYHRLLVDRRPLMPSEQSRLLHDVLLRD